MKVSKRSFRQKNPVRLIPHWRKGSYGGVCLPTALTAFLRQCVHQVIKGIKERLHSLML